MTSLEREFQSGVRSTSTPYKSRAWTKLLPLVLFFLGLCAVAAAEGESGTSSKAELRLQQGHAGELAAALWSPDGRVVATASLDGTVRLWEGKTGNLLRVLIVDDDEIRHLAWSPDGRLLATAKFDGTLRIWEAANGELRHQFTSGARQIRDLAWSPDGKVLAVCDADPMARLWEVQAGRILHSLEGHDSWVESVSWSPDGRTVATSSADGTVRLWTAKDGQLLRTLSGHTAGVWSVAWSPDGKTLASISADETARLWASDTGQELHTLRGHKGGLLSVAWRPDGSRVLTGSADQTAILWDAASGTPLHTFSGHQGWLGSVAWSPDGDRFATASEDGTARIWDQESGLALQLLADHTEQVRSVSWASGGESIVTASYDGTAKIWEAKSGRLLHTLAGQVSGLFSALWSPDGQSLALAGADGTISIWDLLEGRVSTTCSGHRDWVQALAWSPDGTILASAGDDRTVRLWDPKSGEALGTLTGHQKSVRSLAWSPSSSSLASSSFDGTVRVWDVPTGQTRSVLTGDGSEIGTVLWSSDGRRLVTGSTNGKMCFWDPESGALIEEFPGQAETASSMAWSPDEDRLATANYKEEVSIWDSSTGELLETFSGQDLFVTHLEWSPDGARLAASGVDRTIRIWSSQTGLEELVLKGHSASVLSVSWSPDGRFLVSASEDGTARLWDPFSGRELAALANFPDGAWAVLTPGGLFDASEEGRGQLHLALGLESISLEQLKGRYWVPGLLTKLLRSESLPEAPALSATQLYPEISATVLPSQSGDALQIELTNRGGGIGPVRVLVNGIELEGDSRGPGVDPAADYVRLELDLQGVHLKAGQENEIQVMAWNEGGYLRSRAVRTLLSAPEDQVPVEPRLFALVVGVSSYTARSLDLVYSGKDAWDIATALILGGGELFGEERVNVTVLSSVQAGGELPRGLSYDEPSRANIEAALDNIRDQARAEDVLLVYLAGHGLTLGGRDGLYCFLTQEANSAAPEAYLDPAVRRVAALSSEDLVEYLKAIPALKRVLILDTCAAGSASERLVALRDLSGDQLLALDRMRDRTGLHVLMGSAADRVSYEATRYRQGLLTYSLLKGMKGAALRDGGLVDVSRLLQYARDEVPRLAQDIGGSQNPEILTPAQAESFDIGLMSEGSQAKIRLATPVPLVLHPIFQDPDTLDDQLKLGPLVAAEMRQLSSGLARGEESWPAVAYVDSADMAGAIRPRGGYRVEDNRVELKLVLILGEERLGPFELHGTLDDLPGLARIIARRIAQEGTKL